MTPDLQLQLDSSPAAYLPGEVLKGFAQWNLDSHPKKVEIRLFWFTMGKGTQDVQIVETVSLSPSPVGGEAFQMQLPKTPFSLKGRLISLSWSVELVIEPGKLATRVNFDMGPDRESVVLNAVTDPVTGPKKKRGITRVTS